MISTNSQLPIRSATPMDPIHDEASGIANVERKLAPAVSIEIHGGVTFALGMIVGALIVFALVVTFTR